ncbi:hypothetical protein [Neorhizobium sp. T6_25]|uniref:hypothetical protein n=1 Tax=Neorhizobium sp. T6_25 TaxID=2093833 RepID=UPI00155E3C79
MKVFLMFHAGGVTYENINLASHSESFRIIYLEPVPFGVGAVWAIDACRLRWDRITMLYEPCNAVAAAHPQLKKGISSDFPPIECSPGPDNLVGGNPDPRLDDNAGWDALPFGVSQQASFLSSHGIKLEIAGALAFAHTPVGRESGNGDKPILQLASAAIGTSADSIAQPSRGYTNNGHLPVGSAGDLAFQPIEMRHRRQWLITSISENDNIWARPHNALQSHERKRRRLDTGSKRQNAKLSIFYGAPRPASTSNAGRFLLLWGDELEEFRHALSLRSTSVRLLLPL